TTNQNKEQIEVASHEITPSTWSVDLDQSKDFDQALEKRYENYVNTYLLNINQNKNKDVNQMLIKNLETRISLKNATVKNNYRLLKQGIYDIVYNEKIQYTDIIKKDIFVELIYEN